MIHPRVYTTEEIEQIVSHLRSMFPELTIHQCHDDPRFIYFSQITGEQKVDTIPISVFTWEVIHISECEQIVNKNK